MRRYDIVTGILLILSIIDFALAAPILVQEKLHARVGVANAHKSVRTVSGKRWDEELEKLGEEYFKTSGKSIDSSSTHSSSNPAPLEPDNGPANVVQPPALNLALSTTNPESLTELSCSPASSSSTSSMQGLRARGSCLGVLKLLNDPSFKPFHTFDPTHVATYDTTYSNYADHKLTLAKAHVYTSQPNLNSRPQIDPAADPNFDWEHWINAEDPPPPLTPPRPARPKVPNGQTSGYGPGPPPTGPEPSWPGPPPTEFYSTTVGPSPSSGEGWPTEHKQEVIASAEPPTSPDSELHLDHQSLSAGSAQPEDFLAAIYRAKGKVKESRGISGTTEDVGNVAHW